MYPSAQLEWFWRVRPLALRAGQAQHRGVHPPHRADELILASHIYDHGARMRAYELAAEVRDQLSAEG